MCFLSKYPDTIANAKTISLFVNADNKQAAGEAIFHHVHSMEGKTMTDIFFSRKKAGPQHNVRQEISVDINESGCATTTQMW